MYFFISPPLVFLVFLELILCFIAYRRGWGGWPLIVVFVSVISIFIFAAEAHTNAFRDGMLSSYDNLSQFDEATISGSLNDQALTEGNINIAMDTNRLQLIAEKEISSIIYKVAFFAIGVLIPLCIKKKAKDSK